MTRVRFLRAAAALAVAFFTTLACADVPVPAKLQAQLIAKIAAFDRSFAARAGSTALVLVAFKPGDAESTQLAEQLAAELRSVSDVGGLPKTVDVIPFDGPDAVAAACRDRKAAIVYLSASLDHSAGAFATALRGIDVLSVGATGAHAEAGTVVGFDLEGGKPKIVVNLGAARAQNVSLKGEFLKLTRIVGS